MNVVHVSSECAPWSQTGGLGQVAGALPDALARAGDAVSVYTPLYRSARAALGRAGVELERDVTSACGGEVSIHRLRRADAATVCFVDAPHLYDRAELYGEGGLDYPDNAIRFATLCRAALEAGAALGGGPPDIVHAHDWQAALAVAYLEGGRTRTVLTIHNLGYQGWFDKALLHVMGLDWPAFVMQRFEYYDQINLLKGGIAAADAVTTVSPRYAEEILTPEHGCHLDGFLRDHAGKLSGIVNGIDDQAWNPATDTAIEAPYSADAPAGKARCRDALLAEHGLAAEPSDPVVGIVSRLVAQKGLDLVADLAPELVAAGVRLVVLGSGEAALEDRFRELAAAHPEHVGVTIGFDLSLARRIYAGSDIVAVPSRFEPCGLTQLYAMRYGAVPVVCAVGGLRDTVSDPGDEALAAGRGTGFRFEHATTDGLRWAMHRAVAMYRDDAAGWKTLVDHVMRLDLSWREPAAQYRALYRQLLQET